MTAEETKHLAQKTQELDNAYLLIGQLYTQTLEFNRIIKMLQSENQQLKQKVFRPPQPPSLNESELLK